MSSKGYIAFDLGAESGRAMLATIDQQQIVLEEIHRFSNSPQFFPSGYHWNLQDLWSNLVEGLQKTGEVAKSRGLKLVSLGVDTWGVDFGLVGQSGQLLGLPFAYRDARNPPAMEKAFEIVSRDSLYLQTGIQLMPFNSIFQLLAQHAAEPHLLAQVKHLLFMPDLLHYFFSGVAVNEATIASTSQMINPHNGQWHTDLLKEFSLPHHFLEKIIPAGTKVGTLLEHVAKQAKITEPIDVITPGGHDTASAIAAVPVDATSYDDWAYLSSGTWSLMGVELDKPLVNEQSLKANFTNERGVGNKIRFLKNIAGLWLVQECRRDLKCQGQDLNYTELTQAASEVEPFRTLIDTNHAPFMLPGEMLSKINDFAKSTGQPIPETPGQYVRCCLESLALRYRNVLQTLNTLLDRDIKTLHIVGGGGQNSLLNQMTADALGCKTIVGPFEATAIGNALTQALGRGQVKDLTHIRQIVRQSFELETYQPQNTAAYEAQEARFNAMSSD